MSVNLTFRNKSCHFKKEKYRRVMTSLLNEASDGLVKSVEPCFTKSSESVYVIIRFEHLEGYLLLTIKSHKEIRPSSVKVFNTTEYTGMRDLQKSIRHFIIGARRGKHPLFKFKYGLYIGIKTILNLSKKGYRVITSESNYVGELSEGIYVENKNDEKDRFKVEDKVFLSRLVKLVYCGLVKGYKYNRGVVMFYITEFGFNLLYSDGRMYLKRYRTDVKNKALDGLIENMVFRK